MKSLLLAVIALISMNFICGFTFFKKEEKAPTPDEMSSLWEDIIEARKNNQFEKALKLAEQYGKGDPEGYGLRFQLGKINWGLFKYDEAEKNFQLALAKADPQNRLYVLDNLACLYTERHDFEKALEYALKTKASDSKALRTAVYCNLSKINWHLNRKDQAADNFEEAKKHVDQDEKKEEFKWDEGNDYSSLADAAMLLMKDAEARSYIERAVRAKYWDSRQLLLATLYAASGDPSQARALYTRVNLNHCSPYDIAVFHAAAGSRDEAVFYLKKFFKTIKTPEGKEIWRKWLSLPTARDWWRDMRKDPEFTALAGK